MAAGLLLLAVLACRAASWCYPARCLACCKRPPMNEGGVVLEQSDRCPYCNEPLILHDTEDYFGIRIWVCESVPPDVVGVVSPKAPDG